MTEMCLGNVKSAFLLINYNLLPSSLFRIAVAVAVIRFAFISLALKKNHFLFNFAFLPFYDSIHPDATQSMSIDYYRDFQPVRKPIQEARLEIDDSSTNEFHGGMGAEGSDDGYFDFCLILSALHTLPHLTLPYLTHVHEYLTMKTYFDSYLCYQCWLVIPLSFPAKDIQAPLRPTLRLSEDRLTHKLSQRLMRLSQPLLRLFRSLLRPSEALQG